MGSQHSCGCGGSSAAYGRQYTGAAIVTGGGTAEGACACSPKAYRGSESPGWLASQSISPSNWTPTSFIQSQIFGPHGGGLRPRFSRLGNAWLLNPGEGQLLRDGEQEEDRHFLPEDMLFDEDPSEVEDEEQKGGEAEENVEQSEHDPYPYEQKLPGTNPHETTSGSVECCAKLYYPQSLKIPKRADVEGDAAVQLPWFWPRPVPPPAGSPGSPAPPVAPPTPPRRGGRVKTTKVSFTFTFEGIFSSQRECRCRCCEFRQKLTKNQVFITASKKDSSYNGTWIDPGVGDEDCTWVFEYTDPQTKKALGRGYQRTAPADRPPSPYPAPYPEAKLVRGPICPGWRAAIPRGKNMPGNRGGGGYEHILSGDSCAFYGIDTPTIVLPRDCTFVWTWEAEGRVISKCADTRGLPEGKVSVVLRGQVGAEGRGNVTADTGPGLSKVTEGRAKDKRTIERERRKRRKATGRK